MFKHNILLVTFLIGVNQSLGELFCPPLLAPESTILTCTFPKNHKNFDCSGSWIPDGTVAHYQCNNETTGKVRKGSIKCRSSRNAQHGFKSPYDFAADNQPLPCEIYFDVSSPEFHIYGSEKPQHYNIPAELMGFDYLSVGLQLINSFRQKHNSSKLELDATMSKRAEKWANELAIDGTLVLAPEESLGQNVFKSDQENELSAVYDAIKYWYHSGISQYNWTNLKQNWNNPLALDFSQVVWRSSRKFGLGASSPSISPSNKGIVVVAFYFPMGNVVLEDNDVPEKLFIENVVPLSKTSSK